ncbi:hypothetical protein V1478_002664 [Vespula squamosa]|uniref:Uncharacterized protein n=1 Tax=Vespula squamosa TaxID=30214 RepID=A0ABD2BT76_VESSQ
MRMRMQFLDSRCSQIRRIKVRVTSVANIDDTANNNAVAEAAEVAEAEVENDAERRLHLRSNKDDERDGRDEDDSLVLFLEKTRVDPSRCPLELDTPSLDHESRIYTHN